MFRKLFGCALLALVLAAPAHAQGLRNPPPASSAASPALPSDYSIGFSIFSKNRGTVLGPAGQGSGRPGVNVTPVFVGALADETGITGFVRIGASRGASQIITVRQGDTIPGHGSRVTALSLDSIELARDGQAHRTIQVGHSLPPAQSTVTGR